MTSEAGTFQLVTQLLKCFLPPVFAYARNPHVFLEVGLSVVHELSLHSSGVASLPACLLRQTTSTLFSLFSLSLSLTHSPLSLSLSLSHTLLSLFFGLYLLDWSDVTSLHRRVLIGKARILSYSCWNTVESCFKIWKLAKYLEFL
jgi:hypothetical protein